MKDKILITGAAGFIGSHLTEMMTKKGFKVVAEWCVLWNSHKKGILCIK